MSGIPLVQSAAYPGEFFPPGDLRTTHIARPVPEDELREAVVAAARALRAANDDLMARQEEYPDDAYIGAWIAFQAALEHLDALTKGDA